MAVVQYEETFKALVAKVQALKEENNSLREDNLSYRNELKTLREECKVTKQNFDAIQDKVFKHKSQFLKAREECINTIGDLNKVNNERASLRQKLKILEANRKQEVGDFEHKIKTLTDEIAQFKKTPTNLYTLKIAELTEQNIILETEKDALNKSLQKKTSELKIREETLVSLKKRVQMNENKTLKTTESKGMNTDSLGDGDESLKHVLGVNSRTINKKLLEGQLSLERSSNMVKMDKEIQCDNQLVDSKTSSKNLIMLRKENGKLQRNLLLAQQEKNKIKRNLIVQIENIQKQLLASETKVKSLLDVKKQNQFLTNTIIDKNKQIDALQSLNENNKHNSGDYGIKNDDPSVKIIANTKLVKFRDIECQTTHIRTSSDSETSLIYQKSKENYKSLVLKNSKELQKTSLKLRSDLRNKTDSMKHMERQLMDVVTTNDRLLQTLEEEKHAHSVTRESLQAQKIANIKLTEEFHNKAIKFQ